MMTATEKSKVKFVMGWIFPLISDEVDNDEWVNLIQQIIAHVRGWA